MPTGRLLAPLALVVAATTWGLVWYPYRLLERAGLSGSLASLFTYLAGLLVLLLLVALNRPALRPQRGERGLLLALAGAAGWTNFAYVLAVIQGEVVRVMLLFYLAPLWTVPFAHWLLGERADRAAWLVIVLSLAGAWVMLARQGALPLPGSSAEWLGLSAGIGFALSNVLTRKLGETPILLRSLWVFAGVVTVSLIYAGLEGARPPVALPPGGSLWWMLPGIAAALLLATFTVQYGLAHTPANQAIVILLSELVVAAISSRWLAGEAMNLREWIGGSMIVAATLLSGRMKKHA